MPRVVDHDQRHAELAGAVWAIIARRGIEGVTLRSVAVEAGVSVGRIQHYYASREELLRGSCRELIKRQAAEDEPLRSGTDAADRLRLVVDRIPATEELRTRVAAWLAYEAKGVDDPVIAELVVDAHRAAVAEVAQCLRDAGTERPGAALGLVALGQALAVQVLLGGVSPAEATSLLTERIDDALGSRPRRQGFLARR